MSISNVKVLKCILRNFELVSGLRVNFHKSGITGVKVSQGSLDHAASILNCKVRSIPFKFLGILVGENPRKMSTWAPSINSLQKRLLGWSNKFLSFGGRVILIKLSSLVYQCTICHSIKLRKRFLTRLYRFKEDFCGVGVKIVGIYVG